MGLGAAPPMSPPIFSVNVLSLTRLQNKIKQRVGIDALDGDALLFRIGDKFVDRLVDGRRTLVDGAVSGKVGAVAHQIIVHLTRREIVTRGNDLVHQVHVYRLVVVNDQLCADVIVEGADGRDLGIRLHDLLVYFAFRVDDKADNVHVVLGKIRLVVFDPGVKIGQHVRVNVSCTTVTCDEIVVLGGVLKDVVKHHRHAVAKVGIERPHQRVTSTILILHKEGRNAGLEPCRGVVVAHVNGEIVGVLVKFLGQRRDGVLVARGGLILRVDRAVGHPGGVRGVGLLDEVVLRDGCREGELQLCGVQLAAAAEVGIFEIPRRKSHQLGHLAVILVAEIIQNGVQRLGIGAHGLVGIVARLFVLHAGQIDEKAAVVDQIVVAVQLVPVGIGRLGALIHRIAGHRRCAVQYVAKRHIYSQRRLLLYQ